MPCYDPPDGGIAESASLLADSLKIKLDARTDMLCRVCKLMETLGEITSLDSDIRKWWIDHKEFDRKRAEGKS